MQFIKANWPNLLLTLLGSALSTAFALGFAWAALQDRIANAESRLDEIDKSPVAQTHWQVLQNTSAIGGLHEDGRRTAGDLAQINTRLGVIDAKLDAIAETLKRRP